MFSEFCAEECPYRPHERATRHSKKLSSAAATTPAGRRSVPFGMVTAAPADFVSAANERDRQAAVQAWSE
jgi:hypothetical protein